MHNICILNIEFPRGMIFNEHTSAFHRRSNVTVLHGLHQVVFISGNLGKKFKQVFLFRNLVLLRSIMCEIPSRIKSFANCKGYSYIVVCVCHFNLKFKKFLLKRLRF